MLDKGRAFEAAVGEFLSEKGISRLIEEEEEEEETPSAPSAASATQDTTSENGGDF